MRLRTLVLVLAAVFATPAPPGRAAPQQTIVRQNWPCTGCVTVVPSGRTPRPLLVVFHGDEGTPSEIVRAFAGAAERAHMILFAPQCPVALGCRFDQPGGATSSWWGWLQYSQTYDDSWVARQLDRIGAAYRLDRARQYLAGWSGGADYLGWYALRHARRFAAAAFVGGGVPYYPRCPAPGLPAYFLDGAADPRFASGQPGQVENLLASCGAETKLVVLPGADHATTLGAVLSAGYGARIVDWLTRHRRA